MIILGILPALFSLLQSHTLQAEINLSVQAPQTQTLMYAGDIAMRGTCFKVNIMGTQAAYDGQTLFVYSDETEELTLSRPTEEELMQTNPFLFAQALVPQSEVKETPMHNGRVTHIRITPSNQDAEVDYFILVVETATLIPQQVQVHEKDGKTTILTLNKAAFSDKTPAFVLNPEGAFINDLR